MVDVPSVEGEAMDGAILNTLSQRLDRLQRGMRWWKRAGILLLALGALLFAGHAAEAILAASCTAHETEPRSLTCSLGLEWWEDGRKSNIFESWHLTCGEEGRQLWCALERRVFLLSAKAVGTVVMVRRHLTSDGSVMVRRLDWAKGIVSFDVIEPPSTVGTAMPVVMHLKPMFAGRSLLRVVSFQATRIAYKPSAAGLVSEEWRLPEYSYTLNVPIALRGRKSTDEKAREDFMKRLNAADRQVFERPSSGECFDVEAWSKQEPLKTLFASYDKKFKQIEREQLKALKKFEETGEGESQAFSVGDAELTRLVNELFNRKEVRTFLSRKMHRCLVEAGMSQDGAELVSSHFVRSLGQPP